MCNVTVCGRTRDGVKHSEGVTLTDEVNRKSDPNTRVLLETQTILPRKLPWTIWCASGGPCTNSFAHWRQLYCQLRLDEPTCPPNLLIVFEIEPKEVDDHGTVEHVMAKFS